MILRNNKKLYIIPIILVLYFFISANISNAANTIGPVCCYTQNDSCQNFISANGSLPKCRKLNSETCNQFIDSPNKESGCEIKKEPNIGSDNCQSFCAPYNPAPTPPPDTGMPKFKMPELQISIPGLTFTKGEAINCKEENGKKVCNIPWIGEYIAGVYKYAIGIVGILAAVVLMIGGIIWIMAGGSATMIGEAKAWIGASLTGLVIALTSYVILYQINPALVGFKGLNITLVDQIPIPEDIKEFAAKCKPTGNGACATSNMVDFGNKAIEASAICMAESSGNPNAFNKSTKCSNGDYYAVWGLFQFNLSDNTFTDADGTVLNCNLAFGIKPSGKRAWVNSDPTCTVVDTDLYTKCKNAASNSVLSISNAKRLVVGSSGWGPWETNSKWCNF